jgi:hypothetical protein|tara:strand:- start:336 stop:638 length:303 start_codon:yes stop_codon:yes gene_type:complete
VSQKQVPTGQTSQHHLQLFSQATWVGNPTAPDEKFAEGGPPIPHACVWYIKVCEAINVSVTQGESKAPVYNPAATPASSQNHVDAVTPELQKQSLVFCQH